MQVLVILKMIDIAAVSNPKTDLAWLEPFTKPRWKWLQALSGERELSEAALASCNAMLLRNACDTLLFFDATAALACLES